MIQGSELAVIRHGKPVPFRGIWVSDVSKGSQMSEDNMFQMM